MKLEALIEHLAWADRAARDQLARMPEGSAERAQATELYAHLAATEHVWLARALGREPRHPVWPELDLEAAAALAAEAARGLRSLVTGASPEELAAEVDYTNSAGRRFRSRIDDIVVHVALHGCYHRGQLALLARRSGSVPEPTDYIAWVRGAPAATRTDR